VRSYKNDVTKTYVCPTCVSRRRKEKDASAESDLEVVSDNLNETVKDIIYSNDNVKNNIAEDKKIEVICDESGSKSDTVVLAQQECSNDGLETKIDHSMQAHETKQTLKYKYTSNVDCKNLELSANTSVKNQEKADVSCTFVDKCSCCNRSISEKVDPWGNVWNVHNLFVQSILSYTCVACVCNGSQSMKRQTQSTYHVMLRCIDVDCCKRWKC